ncbi:hypothetical protein Slin15195_G128150 [Septoria linicola]|uniref:ABM domain-containing protein n=1 Tax=Septoria linicola TaxID=215465 RepID=A0A9Q9B9F9_9PEZI|nr:hypothetical protein Slin14017_G084290 [Septoria linicola]USW59496.1 hypothetical protein Slin15195_G128150 [Septoria linicola]
MFYATFEQTIPADKFSLAAAYYTTLKPILTESPGALFHAPYSCPYDATQYLALAKFSNETAVQAWRTQHDHARIQEKSREQVFNDYRVRVGPLEPLSKDKTECSHTTTANRGRFLVIYEQPLSDMSRPLEHQDIPILLGPSEDEDDEGEEPGSCIDVLKGLVDSAVYQNDTSLIWLSAWPTRDDAVRYVSSIDRTQEDNVNLVRVSREYSMSDREEAPE